MIPSLGVLSTGFLLHSKLRQKKKEKTQSDETQRQVQKEGGNPH